MANYVPNELAHYIKISFKVKGYLFQLEHKAKEAHLTGQNKKKDMSEKNIQKQGIMSFISSRGKNEQKKVYFCNKSA